MPTNREIYERGVLDAEQDDLNPFYYQHYYYYRKGYDEARRRLRRAPAGTRPPVRSWMIGVLIAGLVLLGLFFGARLLPNLDFSLLSAAQPEPSPTAEVLPTTPPPTPTPRPTPRPTASPTPAPQMAPGAVARVVDLNGAPLRMRDAPSQNARLIARIPQGSEVTLLEGPVEADGFVWWRVQAEQGEGWSAGGTSDGTTQFLEPVR